MSEIKTGGPAFPTARVNINGVDEQNGIQAFGAGMTLRDYFAAQALTGAQIWDAVLNGTSAAFANGGVDKLAETAYAVADAMLKARGQA